QWINRSMSSHREIEYCQTLVKPFEDYQKQVLIHFCSRNFLIDQIGYSRFILTSLTITQYHSIDIPNIIDRFEHLVLLNRNDMIQVRNLYGYFNKFTNQSNPDLLSNIEEEKPFFTGLNDYEVKLVSSKNFMTQNYKREPLIASASIDDFLYENNSQVELSLVRPPSFHDEWRMLTPQLNHFDYKHLQHSVESTQFVQN
ncbi:unnamed protein product, partial [Rotaria sordida]